MTMVNSGHTDNEPLGKLSSPFRSSQEAPHDFLLVPSKGNFTSTDFSGLRGFHIGISDDNGTVLSFEHSDNWTLHDRWDETLPLGIIDQLAIDKRELHDFNTVWGQCLKHIKDAKMKELNRQVYDEEQYNCLDFVLKFLSVLGDKLSEHPEFTARSKMFQIIDRVKEDKVAFCEVFVVSKTKEAAEYIKQHRNV